MQEEKIIIVEDQPLLNSMLKRTLSEHYNIVATCTSAKDMVSLCEKYNPDLVLTDIVTKDNANGIFYGKKVKEQFGNKIKVLAITGVPEISFLDKAKKSNLDGLIYKDIDSESLISNILQVMNGYTLFPDNYNYNEENKKLKTLSNKEIKILTMLCNGLERDSIARELNITLGTLKNYISTILDKMNYDSISKLTMFCVSNGYIVPNLDPKKKITS